MKARPAFWGTSTGVLIAVALTSACIYTLPQPLKSYAPQPIFSDSPVSTNTPFQPLALGTELSLAAATVPTLPIRGMENLPTGETVQITANPEISPIPSRTPMPLVNVSSTPVAAYTIWVDPLLPKALQAGLALPPDFMLVGSPQDAMLRLEPGNERSLSSWVYALVTPFATVRNGVSWENLRRAWRGESNGPFAGRPLLVDESTYHVFVESWGEPAPRAIQVMPSEELLTYAWNNPPAWAIVPFEALEPRWKVLEIDGQSPVRKDFNPAAYPLVAPFSLNGEAELADAVRLVYGQGLLPDTNREADRLTVLTMTGVTALVRATAFAMERKGVRYPGLDVGSWLREADLTHISNEVPFAEDCPYPDPFQLEMRFCSDPRYIGLLEDVGADIIELTGDHFQDWGANAMKLTLKLYQERGWYFYGGGSNLEEARKAIIVEHNGNRLAFIGCNAKGGAYAQAKARQPGAASCDYEWMQAEIARLREQGYLPVATFQHFEYYTYKPQGNQKRDFRSMADAGAVIVSGSQAHQPQALEFRSGALIHYGLGNLFFDQYDVSPATRQGFIDRHIFYDGRYISTELLPIMFVDYARPRPMTAQEANELLEAVFAASGW
jgi:hypothetical protein